MKRLSSRLKPFLRWAILGGTLFFLGKALKDHWQEVAAIRITGFGWLALMGGLVVTLLAHVWSGWVWGWILQDLRQPVSAPWAIATYLKVNIAKYLPGNIWHFYGRTQAAIAVGVPFPIATLSVLLEPLLMAAAALIVALLTSRTASWGLQSLSLLVVLIGLHPRILNFGIHLLKRLKGKNKISEGENAPVLTLDHYPIWPLLGEIGFLGLRSAGFLLTFLALQVPTWSQVPQLISTFSLAWLLGLVVPGAPGGIGVFEATAIALLGQSFSPALILSVVALYRLISILAESIGAGLAAVPDTNFKLRT